jgi:hypothetical protein
MVLSVMAVFAVGAVAASAASAAPHWVIEGKALAAGESETVLALISGPAILHGLIGKVGFELTCTAAHASGTIKGTNTDAAPNGIPFAGCTVNHPTGCTAVEPISTKALTSELLTTEEGKRRQDTWTAPAEEFAEITVSGTACSVEGKYLVKGKAQCEGESGEAVDFSCLFNAKSGSVLKLGVNETDFLAHFLFLLTGAHAGKKWGTS